MTWATITLLGLGAANLVVSLIRLHLQIKDNRQPRKLVVKSGKVKVYQGSGSELVQLPTEG